MLSTIQKELEETKVSVKRISAVQKELEETKNKALKVKMKRIHPFSYLVALFAFLSKMWTRSYDDGTVNCKEVNGRSSCTLTPPQPTPTTRAETTPVTRGRTTSISSKSQPWEGQPVPPYMKESIAFLLSMLLGMQRQKGKIGNLHF